MDALPERGAKPLPCLFSGELDKGLRLPVFFDERLHKCVTNAQADIDEIMKRRLANETPEVLSPERQKPLLVEEAASEYYAATSQITGTDEEIERGLEDLICDFWKNVHGPVEEPDADLKVRLDRLEELAALIMRAPISKSLQMPAPAKPA